jgi:uncharacterized protein YukE
LEEGIDRYKQLLLTIDKTIDHLEGKTKMKYEELYVGFEEKIKEYEQIMVASGKATEEDHSTPHFLTLQSNI